MFDIEKRAQKLIERAIERSFISPIQADLQQITETRRKADDDLLKSKINRLRSKNQSFFLVPKSHTSCDNWATAVYELARLPHELFPSGKILVLMKTAKEIYRSHRIEQERSGN